MTPTASQGPAPLLAPSRLDLLLKDLEVPPALKEAALAWADSLASYSGNMKEEANRSQFLELFRKGLGYTHGAHAKGTLFHLKEKPKTDVGNQFPDVSLGLYGGPNHADTTFAVLELKESVNDLDAKQSSGAYAKTPVEQAFGYALKFAEAQFVLVSNFKEIRLYSREGGDLKRWSMAFHRLLHEDQPRLLKELWFFLAPERLLPPGSGQVPPLLRHMREAPVEQEKLTRAFYQEFRELRDEARSHYTRLLREHPGVDPEAGAGAEAHRREAMAQGVRPTEGTHEAKGLESAQKLLNRTLFAGFAQSRRLLPEGLLQIVTSQFSPLEEKPVFRNLSQLFKHLDKGRDLFFTGPQGQMKIPGFNGGLFRTDAVVDGRGFALSEDFALKLLHLANKDFVTELSVSVLGHCFEASLADLDAARGGGERHDQGIYYTPDWVTRYVCLKVLSPLVARCRAHAEALVISRMGPCPPKDHHRWHLARFHAFHGELEGLRILDPACGSGAFLAQGLRVLRELMEPDLRLALAEASNLPDTHEDAVHEDFQGWNVATPTERDEALAKLRALPSLETCFYGVDLHEEAVLLTQLSLWLESADRGRKLSDLSTHIKCANSLTANWDQLFRCGAFDAVIGNPPYVRMELFKDLKPHLKQHFPEVHEERADLYCYFFQLSLERLKEGGRYGIIVSNKWLKAKYGAPSRAYLKAHAQIEELLDFGELPVFEEAAVMPHILVAERRACGTKTPLRFAQIPELPITDGELEVLAETHEVTVSADQLAEDAWLLVNEAQVRTESPWRCSPIGEKLETELNAAVDAAWEA